MPEDDNKPQSTAPKNGDRINRETGSHAAGEDGRTREYQDRSRVNLDPDPAASTNLERDFEPEENPAKKNEEPPAY